MHVVEAANLTRCYRNMVAVDDVSLNIAQGEIYGFLGLNGAGKTTTMRMLLGMIKPTRGHVRLLGETVKNCNWRNIGYMIESTHAYPNLSVNEYLKVFQLYYGLKDDGAIERVISLLNLKQYAGIKAEHLSLGNLQRLGLAKALLHEPELLILDEPVNGLDPAGIVEVRLLLKSLSKRGVTILVSSHLLGEVTKIADKIGIIHQGKLIAEINSDNLAKQLFRKLIVSATDNRRAADLLANIGIKSSLSPIGELEITEGASVESPERISMLLAENNLPVKKLFTWEEDLESFFLRIISQSAP